jgi:hypothetical protein
MRDWWQNRELDRQLAVELGSAYEKFRLASLRLHEITEVRPMSATPDLSARVQEASAARALAYAEYVGLLERWRHFVIHGRLPEESAADSDPKPKQLGAS